MKSALYVGTVMHARRSPRDHVFRYPVYMALLDLDELPTLDRRLRLFGWNRRAVTSFHDEDHIDIHAILAGHGVELGVGGSIQVLTNLRVLGYDDRFLRIWTFYLAYCEAGFAIRSLRDMQIVLTHSANDALPQFPSVRPGY